MAPHVDLSRVDPFCVGRRSTHTFLLYLTDCAAGGETALLRRLPRNDDGGNGGGQGGGDNDQNDGDNLLAAVAPRRGRLLLFPHACPHEGRPVVDVPKVFLRGELF